MDLSRFKKNTEPPPDKARCSICNKRGYLDKFITATDGDWESGYYEILLCPKCPDGGCVDDYYMSAKRAKEWHEWRERSKK